MPPCGAHCCAERPVAMERPPPVACQAWDGLSGADAAPARPTAPATAPDDLFVGGLLFPPLPPSAQAGCRAARRPCQVGPRERRICIPEQDQLLHQRPYQPIHRPSVPLFDVLVKRVEAQLECRLEIKYAARCDQPLVDTARYAWNRARRGAVLCALGAPVGRRLGATWRLAGIWRQARRGIDVRGRARAAPVRLHDIERPVQLCNERPGRHEFFLPGFGAPADPVHDDRNRACNDSPRKPIAEWFKVYPNRRQSGYVVWGGGRQRG